MPVTLPLLAATAPAADSCRGPLTLILPLTVVTVPNTSSLMHEFPEEM